jgi:cell wall-associated NlpC family hydrolase
VRVGDTVFFDNTCTNCGPNPTHEGLYLGNGLMIDAGDAVQIEPVFWNKVGHPPYPKSSDDAECQSLADHDDLVYSTLQQKIGQQGMRAQAS